LAPNGRNSKTTNLSQGSRVDWLDRFCSGGANDPAGAFCEQVFVVASEEGLVASNFVGLWRWEGRIGRKTYAIAGITAFVLKFFLDKIVTSAFFGREWHLWSYFQPLGPAGRVNGIRPDAVNFVFVLLLLALPFISLGVTLTVQRLRDAGQPVWLVVLFFVPVINLLFFLLLCLMESQTESRPLAVQREARPWPETRPLDGWIPRSGLGAAFFSIGLTIVIGLVFCVMGTEVLRSYGWGLFVALPFCLGLFSVLTYSYHEPRSLSSCMGVALAPIGLIGALLLVVALEGIICILMAAPFAIALAALGGAFGYSIQAGFWAQKGSPAALSIVLFFSPVFQGAEYAVKLKPELFEVRTSIEVNAPPQKVWDQVVAFAEIPPPKELLFRAGLAYPIRAEISGHGAGAVRHCVFSTGPFVEPIEVWDEPRLLRFGVTSNPAPLNELSPYGHIEPPHLHGFFVSEHGQFQLTALPDGRTRLEGTTWYKHTMWPAAYWHLWSDYIIHRIHLRVLEHIRATAEGTPS
jgi:uncharacterized membrane protein YhaH (DUF805 family)